MSKANLLAAVKACPPLSEAWNAAVWALGAGSKAGFPERKPGRPTGLSRGELYHQMLKSHCFDTDRAEWEARWYASPTGRTFDQMRLTQKARQQAEKLAAVAA